ncbi:unnamed protein product [Brassica oleracea]
MVRNRCVNAGFYHDSKMQVIIAFNLSFLLASFFDRAGSLGKSECATGKSETTCHVPQMWLRSNRSKWLQLRASTRCSQFGYPAYRLQPI